MSAGRGHIIVLYENGEIWGLGNNFFGQLGDGTNTNRQVPVKISFDQELVVDIATGSDYTILLTDEQRIYTFGDNSYGQLGDGSTLSKNRPVPVSSPNNLKFKRIVAGSHHSVFLAEDSDVYTCGKLMY